MQELCELHPTTLGMIEIGKRVPSFDKLKLFAEKPRVNYSILFDFSSNEKLKELLVYEIESLDSQVIKALI